MSFSKAKVEAIRRQAHKNMRLIMKKLNFKGYDYGNRLVGCCPVPHNDARTPNDNDKAFSWDFDRQMWQCFSHRCNNVHGSDVFALIRSVKRCSFPEAVSWVLELIDKDVDEIEELKKDEVQEIEQVIRKRAAMVKHKEAESDLMKHLKPSNYFQQRGYSDEVVNTFNCGGEWHKVGTYGENRAIVPVYDPIDGYLIAFTCRLLNDDDIESWRPKWCHALNFAAMRKKSADRTDEERFHASSVLYNLHRAKQEMGDQKTIIVVEGPGDVMRMWEAGIKNVVAVLGTAFSKHHRTLLHNVGCNRVVCVLDGDEAGQKASNSMKKMCADYFNYEEVKMPSGRDPGDHDPAQLRMIFKEYTQ